MANPKAVLQQMKNVPKTETKVAVEPSCCINEMIQRVFATRNLVHFAHWATNSFAAHEALGGLYNQIVAQVDEIVEVYQGKFGLLSGLSTISASQPSDILAHIKAEQEWVCDNKEAIACDNDAIENLIDELDAAYLKVIYKLENLK